MFPDMEIVPTETAVVAVDFQQFFISDGHPMGNAHARDILDNANRINQAARSVGALVILTQHSVAEPGAELRPSQRPVGQLVPGSASFDIHPQIVRSNHDINLTKHQSSALHPKSESGLLDLLLAKGIKSLIITGIASNGCCDCLARDAFQHGFNVFFVSDATAAMSDEEHNAALLNLGLYYARIRTTEEIVHALLRDGETVDAET